MERLSRGWPAIRKTKNISRKESLAAVPVRNEAVSENRDGEGNLTLTLPMRNTGVIRVVSKLFFMPGEKKIQLDEIGSWVWRKCDGRTDVEGMIRMMSEEFKLSRKESEVSLFSFLRSMSKKKLVGFEIKAR